MFSPVDVLDFFELLDEFDSVAIEENQWGEGVTLERIKCTNTGNNCLHYCLVYNNCRIVIQTYKDMARKGNVDIVQGKPELEPLFEQIIDTINSRPQDYTDDRLNKLFVLYCGMWQKCSSFYRGEMNSFLCEFGSNLSIVWIESDNIGWLTCCEDATIDQIIFLVRFMDAMNEICDG